MLSEVGDKTEAATADSPNMGVVTSGTTKDNVAQVLELRSYIKAVVLTMVAIYILTFFIR